MNTELIRTLRQQKNITLDQLAKKTGLSKGYLSKIENSDSLPPFPTMQKIANALGEELTQFIKSKDKQQISSNLDIIIAGEDDDIMQSIGGYSYQKMVTSYENKYMSPLLMQIEPGKTGDLKHDGEEFVFIVKGTAVLEYEGESYTLPERSGAYLDSRIKHVFVNNANEPLLILAVNYNYRRF
jgi:transcriptional regulator with XRE-family HTH domain